MSPAAENPDRAHAVDSVADAFRMIETRLAEALETAPGGPGLSMLTPVRVPCTRWAAAEVVRVFGVPGAVILAGDVVFSWGACPPPEGPREEGPRAWTCGIEADADHCVVIEMALDVSAA